MRRLLTFAAFLLIVSLVPMCAQRGARGSGGSHGGVGSHGGFVSHGSGGPGFGGSHFGPGVGSHVVSHRGPGLRSFARDEHFRGFRNDHFRGRRFGDHSFRNRRNGYWGYGYPYYAYYDPYWWWDSYPSYDEDAARERALANEMNAENLEEQRMHQQDQDLYARPMSRPRESQSREEARAQTDPPTVLVFHDQHQREIQNYAIVGQMLWNFTSQRTEKIPLAELDIPATAKANEDRGIEFHLPRASEGQ